MHHFKYTKNVEVCIFHDYRIVLVIQYFTGALFYISLSAHDTRGGRLAQSVMRLQMPSAAGDSNSGPHMTTVPPGSIGDGDDEDSGI